VSEPRHERRVDAMMLGGSADIVRRRDTVALGTQQRARAEPAETSSMAIVTARYLGFIR
jgi:hypothetical protein